MLETNLLLVDKVSQALSGSATRSWGNPAEDMSYYPSHYTRHCFPISSYFLRERSQPRLEGHRKMSRILGQGQGGSQVPWLGDLLEDWCEICGTAVPDTND